jgi:outer membrane lipoprotein LolB
MLRIPTLILLILQLVSCATWFPAHSNTIDTQIVPAEESAEATASKSATPPTESLTAPVVESASQESSSTYAANFNISGRFAVIKSGKNHYGNFTWHKTDAKETLFITTPFGQSLAVITVESNISTLSFKDKTYSGNNFDDLMLSKLGFILPINYLNYWIQGIPLPQKSVSNQSANGFNQLGWQIEYLSLNEQNKLPRIIKCTNLERDIIVKLFIKW